MEPRIPDNTDKEGIAVQGMFALNSAVGLTAENANISKRGGYELIADVFHSPGGWRRKRSWTLTKPVP
ncbi:MAG: hypothetical protein WCL11_25075, partial [Verrucomicrobiota bacterium]